MRLSGAHTAVPARCKASLKARWVSVRNSPAEGVGAWNREWTNRTRRSVIRQPLATTDPRCLAG